MKTLDEDVMMIKKIYKPAIFILLVLIFIAMTLMFACEDSEYNRDNGEEIGPLLRFNSEYINRYISTGKKVSDLNDDDVVKIIGEISLLSLTETDEQVAYLCDYTEDRIQEYVNYDAGKDVSIGCVLSSGVNSVKPSFMLYGILCRILYH